jgi:hypothetical protein
MLSNSSRLAVEAVEPRRLLAAVAWDGGGDGVTWNDSDNWSTNTLPSAADDVTINVASNPTILLFGGGATINSLVSSETLRVTSTLTVNSTATLNAPTRISGAASMTVFGNLTVNDVLTLGNSTDSTYGVVYFQGPNDVTLGGTGSIASSGPAAQYIYNYTYDNVTGFGKKLTIGSGIETNLVGGYLSSGYNSGTIQNDGPITFTGAIASQLGNGTTRYINNSTITVNGGATINSFNLLNNAGKTITLTDSTINFAGDVNAAPFSWDNNGTINAANTVINLGGIFSLADVGTINRTSGGQLNVAGVLDLAAGTLNLDNAKGSWGIASGGRLKNGTVTRTAANTLIPRGGILDNITLNMPLTVAQNAYLYIENSIVLNDVLTLGAADNTYGVLYFQGDVDHTVGGTGSVLTSGTSIQYIYNYTYNNPLGTGRKVTFGSGIEISATAGLNFYSGYLQGTIQNDGPLSLTGPATTQLGNGTTRFINNSTITATAGAIVNSFNLLNNSGKTISLTDSTLNLNGDPSATPLSWDNNGTINANNSIVNLGGSIGLADIGTLVRTNGGQVNVAGLLDLAGATLTLDNTRGSWGVVSGGRIKNGTIARTGTNEFIPRGGIIDNITLNLPVNVAQYTYLYVENGLVLNDTLTLGAVDNSYGVLQLQGGVDQTLGGTGNIVSVGTAAAYIYNYTYDTSVGIGKKVTIGSGIEINLSGVQYYSAYAQGSLQNDGPITLTGAYTSQLGGGSSRIINNGTITVSGGATVNSYNLVNNAGKTINVTGSTFNLYGDALATPFTWDNNGTINSSNSIINLGGTFNASHPGTIVRTAGGEVNVAGVFDLEGGTFTFTNTTGSWGLVSGGRIKNGTLSRTGTNTLIPRSGIIDAVTLNLPVKVAQYAYLYVENNLVLNDTLTLGDVDNSYGVIQFQGATDQSLTGTGNIVTSGTNTGYFYNYTYDGSTATGKNLTIGSGIEITGRSYNINLPYAGTTIINDGQLIANDADGTWIINGAATSHFLNANLLKVQLGILDLQTSWNNTGTLEITGGLLKLGGTFGLSSIGTFTRSGGSVWVSGLLDLAGGTLTLDSVKGSWGIATGGVIKNGTIARTGSNILIGMSGSVETVVLNVPVTVSSNQILNVNQVTVNDVITLGNTLDNSYGQIIVYGGSSQTLNGTGAIVGVGTGYAYFTNNTYDTVTSLGRTVTIGSGIEFTGMNGYLSSGYNNGRITIAGTVGSVVAGGLFQFVASTNASFVNQGTILASGGGESRITQLFGNAGNLNVTGAGSVMDVTGIYDVNQAVTVGPDALLILRGEWTKSATFDVGGGVVFDYGTSDPSPLTTLYAELLTGYAGGAWNGAGIKSTRALSNSSFALGMANSAESLGAGGGTFMNRYVDASSVILRYTRKGDANVDGDVDFDDLLRLAQNYSGTGKVWSNGDSNYNGLVNFDDLLSLAQNYGLTALSTATPATSTSRSKSRFGEESILA